MDRIFIPYGSSRFFFRFPRFEVSCMILRAFKSEAPTLPCPRTSEPRGAGWIIPGLGSFRGGVIRSLVKRS